MHPTLAIRTGQGAVVRPCTEVLAKLPSNVSTAAAFDEAALSVAVDEVAEAAQQLYAKSMAGTKKNTSDTARRKPRNLVPASE